MTLIIFLISTFIAGLVLSVVSKQLPKFDLQEWEASARELLKIDGEELASTQKKSSYWSWSEFHGELVLSYRQHVMVAIAFCLACYPSMIFFQDSISMVLFLGIVGCLSLAAIVDFRHKYIPDISVLVGMGLTFCLWINLQYDLTTFVIGSMVGYAIIALYRIAYLIMKREESIGLGDAKLMALAGALVGIGSLFYLLLGACIMAILAVLLSRYSEKEIPFGPSIATASLFFFYWSFAS